VDNLEMESLHLHRRLKGKIEIAPRKPLQGIQDLALLYTPGVAAPCREISRDRGLVYEYTAKGNTVAIITNGTAVLGLGDIGPEAALPVMEGKALLFKTLAGIDAFPICLDCRDPAEVIRVVQAMAPSFGGINLEDIAAPDCFEIERCLRETLNIPVFHDDQHGTAVVVAAGLVNALRLTGRRIEETKVVINGAGAAGVATAHLFLKLGVQHLRVCDRLGVLYPGRPGGMNPYKEEIAALTNPTGGGGTLADTLRGADVFVGLSRGGLLTRDMVRFMAPKPIVFALANPEPEISRDQARAAGAAVIATGRSDCPNQINNVLAFPGVFRGALDARATDINGAMKIAAVRALSELVGDDLHPDYIIPEPVDPRVAPSVALAVAAAAVESGVSRADQERSE